MRHLIYPVILMLFSCKKTDLRITPQFDVDTVGAQYFIKWNYTNATGTFLLARSRFAYDHNQPIKRSGSYLPVALGGWDYNSYTDQVYDTIIKLNNQKILLQSLNKLPFVQYNFPKWEIEIYDNRPLKRITYNYSSGSYKPADTAVYYYGANNRVQKIEFHFLLSSFYPYLLTKTFFFDNGNLQKVVGVCLQKPNSVQYSTEETFGSYDNKANPLKALWLWDDLYYRSISSNNFSTYTYKRFDSQNNLTEWGERTWILKYDENGNVVFK